MKAVMISIQPNWCDKIADGLKTIEVRKTKPNIARPFKCYIYCTYGNTLADLSNCSCKSIEEDVERGAVKRYALQEHKIKEPMYSTCAYGNGKVIGEFVCDKIDGISKERLGSLCLGEFDDVQKSYLTEQQIWDYCGKKDIFYLWHISDLVIYDKPKRLWDFYNPCHSKEKCIGWGNCDCAKVVESGQYVTGCPAKLTRPPQSWCYVEE